MTTEQPDWLLQLQRDLCIPVLVPDGAIINWDQCRDRFLILQLQRLEPQTRSSHPAIVRQLLQRRLAGDDVAAELFAALPATPAATDELLSAAAQFLAAATERTAQLADLQAAIAAATQPAALPANYIDDNITGPDRELLTAFYTAANSEGGTADEIHIRGIRAAIAQAASGFAEPPLPTNNLAPVRSADRPWKEPGWCDARGQCWWTVDDRTMDRRRWTLVNPALLGGGWVLPHWAIPAIPAAETNPAEVQPWPGGDVTFSDGLTAAQHLDVLRGGPDPRLPAPTDDELLQSYGRARRAYQHAGLRAALAQFGSGAPQLPAPGEVTEL